VNSHQAGDTFDITVESGKVCAKRTDSGGGWGMNLQINCEAAAQLTVSVITIGSSGDNKKCVNRQVESCAGDAGDKGKRVNSHQAGDTFDITVEGGQVCAKRTDSGGGWGMKLQVNCLIQATNMLPIGQCVALHSKSHNRFIRMNKHSNMDASGSKAANDLPNNWSWERFTVVDAGNGQVALHSSQFNKFIRMNQHKDMDASSSKGVNDLPSNWAWERFTVVDGGNGEVALHNSAHNRYIRMPGAGNMDASNHMASDALPDGWSWERFTPVNC